jgi:hypothetical protein
MIAQLFWLLTLLACGYAASMGGRDGRWAASLIIAAAVLTIPAARVGTVWGEFEPAVFLVDAGLLTGLFVLVLRSRRWWPIWMTGFHLLAVTSHLAAWLSSGFVPEIYFAAASFSAVPVPVCMAIGVSLDRRALARRRAR